MTGCCALHCKNRSENGFKVYSFPTDRTRRTVWEKRIGRMDFKGNPWTASRCAKLCEVHFEGDQFELHRMDGKKKLKWNAVPSIFAKTRAEAFQLYKKRDFQPSPHTGASSIVRNHKDHSYSCDGAPPLLISVQSIDDIDTNVADDHSYGIRSTAGKDKDKVCRLRDRIRDYQFQLRKARDENLKLQKRQTKVRESLSKLFGSDQIQALRRGGSMRGIEWTSETVQKALKMYAACGKKGYSCLLEQHFPLPSIRTLQRHVKGSASAAHGHTLPIQEETDQSPQDDDLTLESISSLLACLTSPDTPLDVELQT